LAVLRPWEGSLSPFYRFNGHFPGGPGLAGTRKYPFWILLELRVMEVVVRNKITTGAIRRANLQSNVTTLRQEIFGSALLQPARSVCVSPSAFFIHNVL